MRCAQLVFPPKNEVGFGLPGRCKQSKEQPAWLLRLLLWCPSETRNPNAKLKNLDMAALPAIFGKGREVTLTLCDFPPRGIVTKPYKGLPTMIANRDRSWMMAHRSTTCFPEISWKTSSTELKHPTHAAMASNASGWHLSKKETRLSKGPAVSGIKSTRWLFKMGDLWLRVTWVHQVLLI